MGMEILNQMNNDFQPFNPFTSSGDNNQNQRQHPPQQHSSASPSTGDSYQGSSLGTTIDPPQNDLIAAELRRMQHAREGGNTALLQLLGRQQQMAADTLGSSSSANSHQFNGMNSSSGCSNFGSSQMNNFMGAQSLMGNSRDMNVMGAMDSLSGTNNALGSQPNNFMTSSFMNSGMNTMNGGTMNGGTRDNSMNAMNQAMNLNNIPSAASANSASSNSTTSQFNKVDRPLGQQMNNFMAASFMNPNQGNHSNSLNPMDPISMNELLQKNQLMSAAQGMSAVCGMNSALSMAGSAAAHPPQEDPGWEEQCKALRAYHLQFGNCKVPARYKMNAKLGRWVMTQRRQFTLLMQGFPSALTADRISRLESLGFTWSVRPEPVTTWNRKFQELKSYKSTYGNCMVPQRYQLNPQLGTWVHTQRRQFKLMSEGKKSSMTKEKADALDSIGFFWAAKNSAVLSSSNTTIGSSMLPLDEASHSDGSDQSNRAKAA